MGSQSGQASIEWVALVLVAALALAALAALARAAGGDAGRGPGGPDLALAGLRATTCGIGGPCRRGNENARLTRASVATPGSGVATPGSGHAMAAPPLLPPLAVARLRRHFGAAWRRAWLLCLAYERARYGMLHPESAVRGTVPLRGVLQMVNDCVSPIDFARDWEGLRR